MGKSSNFLPAVNEHKNCSKFEKKKPIDIKKLLLYTIPFIAMFAYVFLLIYPNLGDMLIPVFIYSGTILVLGSLSMYFYVNNRVSKLRFLMMGAVLFVCSDAVLATQLFHTPIFIKELLIMSTYAFAQYFLVRYMMIKHV